VASLESIRCLLDHPGRDRRDRREDTHLEAVDDLEFDLDSCPFDEVEVERLLSVGARRAHEDIADQAGAIADSICSPFDDPELYEAVFGALCENLSAHVEASHGLAAELVHDGAGAFVVDRYVLADAYEAPTNDLKAVAVATAADVRREREQRFRAAMRRPMPRVPVSRTRSAPRARSPRRIRTSRIVSRARSPGRLAGDPDPEPLAPSRPSAYRRGDKPLHAAGRADRVSRGSRS
jgi:hypothetical protein